MAVVPADTPVATPVALTVATPGLLLVHDSVLLLLAVSAVVAASHTVRAPVIAGLEITVTTAVAAQPFAPV